MSQPSTASGATRPSPALSSRMAGSESNIPDMISDGKRMRAVWRPEHGPGDSTQHVIDRCKASVRGHPTWKVFIDDVPQPIVRGSNQEPPYYVYLDDHSCFAVWKSQQYTDKEMKVYWPFDFDHQGNIKAGRPNRGRPAWKDSDVPEIEKGKLRGKSKWYEFTGEPEMTEYKPLRPASKTKMELQVEVEWVARNSRSAGAMRLIDGTLGTTSTESNITTSGGTPVTNTDAVDTASLRTARAVRLDRVCASRASPPKYPPSKYWQTPGGPIPAQSLKDGVKPKPPPSRSPQGSLCDDEAYHVRTSLPPVALRKNLLSNPSTPPPKRKPTSPFLVSSSPTSTTSSSPDHNRIKVGDRRSSLSAKVPLTNGNVSPNEKLGNRGEQRLSPMPLDFPELPPSVDRDSSSEEDEFLANVGQALNKKREGV